MVFAANSSRSHVDMLLPNTNYRICSASWPCTENKALPDRKLRFSGAPFRYACTENLACKNRPGIACDELGKSVGRSLALHWVGRPVDQLLATVAVFTFSISSSINDGDGCCGDNSDDRDHDVCDDGDVHDDDNGGDKP